MKVIVAGRFRAFLHRSGKALPLTVVAAILLAGCGGGYEGYKTKPYKIRGQTYYPLAPRDAIGYVEEGVASHFDESFLFVFPGKSALGEKQWPWTHAAAHKTLPIPCRIRVTNLRNGKSMVLRVNDRGPFISGRVLDVTSAAAKKLGFHKQGLTRVRLEVLSVGDGRYRIRR